MSPDGAACPHGADHIAQRLCVHLLRREVEAYSHAFRGRGLDYDLVCPTCAEAGAPDSRLARVCAACFEEASARATWSTGPRAIIGQPEIAERATRLAFTHEMVRLRPGSGTALLDMQPRLGDAPGWLGLTRTGALVVIDLVDREARPVATIDGAGVDLDKQLTLTLSPDGQMAAVVEVRGQSGVVIDVATGAISMLLDRGAHEVPGSRFPIAFLRVGGRLVLVHATAWNRLDAFDPKTGEQLTLRPPAEQGAHQLDYVSSGLRPSPDGEWLVDNGFSPQGAGVVATFRARRWLEENPWEAEDGPSKRYLCQRWDLWDGPLAWLGPGTLAVWGYGPDRASILPAVIVFDVDSGEALRWFPGPRGDLVFDGTYLHSLGDGEGVSVWDPRSGERLLHDAGFHPLRYHPATRQFLTGSPDGELFVVSRLGAES